MWTKYSSTHFNIVIQENGRLTFEDDLRSGGLSMNASVRTGLADIMVTPGEPGGD